MRTNKKRMWHCLAEAQRGMMNTFLEPSPNATGMHQFASEASSSLCSWVVPAQNQIH